MRLSSERLVVPERVADTDVVLMSVNDPLGCAAVIRVIRSAAENGARPPQVLVVSANVADDAILSAVRAGAHGYITKGLSREELIRSIHIVADGGSVFCSAVTAKICAYFSALRNLPGSMSFPALTNREREILELIARGCDNKRIARNLVLSEKTIRNHVTRLFRKLDVVDRASAAVRARDAGMGLLPDTAGF